MALGTYAELKAALPDYLMGRSASDVSDRIDEWFAMAHQRIFYGSGETGFETEALRIRFMEDTEDLTVDAQSIALPADWLQTRRIYLSATPTITPKQTSPSALWEEFPLASVTGRPRAFAIEGSNIVFGPVPDQVYTGKLLYYAKPAVPSADGDTNWLMANAPGVYLRAAEVEAWRFLEEPDKAAEALSAFAGAIRALQMADARDRYTGPPAGMRQVGGNWRP